MIRTLHRWPGLLALILVMALALSGAALSVFPRPKGFPRRRPRPEADRRRSRRTYPGCLSGGGADRRRAVGRITAFWFDDGTPGAAVIDPATGKGIASADPDPVKRWLTNLHRSLFLGDAGRIAMAIGAVAILILSASGAILVARRMGGWRRWFAPLRGPASSRIHTGIARVAVAGLVLSSATALWMAASTFDLLPDGAAPPTFPPEVSGSTGSRCAMESLSVIAVTELRGLNFLSWRRHGRLRSADGSRRHYLDQGTGGLLARPS